jgi:hypothetical protein
MYAVPGIVFKYPGTCYLVSTAAQTFQEYEIWNHANGPLALVLPQQTMQFIGYVKQYGPWTSMLDLYQSKRITAYLEAVFGQNRAGYGLDCYWRVNIAGLPHREIYSYVILLGQTEPCLWWKCKQAIMNGIMSFEDPAARPRL